MAKPPHVIRCHRCKKRCRNTDGWNVTASRGVVTGFLCPDCQTAQENIEAVINEATLDYNADDLGRVRGRAKDRP